MYFPIEMRYKAAYHLIEYGINMIDSLLEDSNLDDREVHTLRLEKNLKVISLRMNPV